MSGYQEVDRQIALGNYWRAKEILQGRLAGSKYDVELFENYGIVLLRMRDDLEAGKYLFLSGVRKAEYEKPIYLYLERYSGKSTRSLFNTFPHSVQVSPVGDYPEAVLSELEQGGHKRSEIRTNSRPPRESVEKESSSTLVAWAAIAIFFVLLAGFLVQGVRGIVWLFEWLF